MLRNLLQVEWDDESRDRQNRLLIVVCVCAAAFAIFYLAVVA